MQAMRAPPGVRVGVVLSHRRRSLTACLPVKIGTSHVAWQLFGWLTHVLVGGGVQDPFELSHDLGRTVDRQTSGVLHKEFERAAAILRDMADPLDKLFEPYRAGKSD